MSRHHVIISGTGRAGTTFLVQLLTALKLDTGYYNPTSFKLRSQLWMRMMESFSPSLTTSFVLWAPNASGPLARKGPLFMI
ncbi:MAG: hypothetical protein ACLQUZ_00180 [Rhizomicrobium sp.]